MKQKSLLDSFIKRQVSNLNLSFSKGQEVQNEQMQIEQGNLRKQNDPNIQYKHYSSPHKLSAKQLKQPHDNKRRSQNGQGNCKTRVSRKKKMDLDSEEEFEDGGQNEQDADDVNLTALKSAGKSDKKQKRGAQNQNKQNLDQNDFSGFTVVTPEWALPHKCKDAAGRTRQHPQYDETTLLIPQNEWKTFSAPMKQYWRIKSENFDKIVLFKLGKFYQLFYQDAAISNKYLDLKWMGTKMHTGFPQKCLDKYSTEFLKLGFKVVVVEQMETINQMNGRIKSQREMGRKSQRTLQRDVTQIFTKGTVVPADNDDNYLPNYLISVRTYQSYFGYALLQVGTNMIAIGIADSFDSFKTVLYQTRPVQLLYDPDNLGVLYVQMMKQNMLQMICTRLANKQNIWHPLNVQNMIQELDKSEILKKPAIFNKIEEFDNQHKNILYATLAGMFRYLKNVMLFDYVMSAAKFTFYSKETFVNTLILDSQALQHLELFETILGEKGSLFHKIDHTRTRFGKRMLRRWLMAPLQNTLHIQQRLNSIDDLNSIPFERNKIMEQWKKLPDLQKLANRLYHYAVKNSSSKAVYFSDLNAQKLRQFKQLLENFEDVYAHLTSLSKHIPKFRSKRLRRLLTPSDGPNQYEMLYYQQETNLALDDEKGLLPPLIESLQQFHSYVRWQENIPIPQKGLVDSYDSMQQKVLSVKAELQAYLDGLRYEIKEPNLRYVHTKQRYQIEVPENADKRKPKDFVFTSKRAGFNRYISNTTKIKVKQLEKLEEGIKQQMTTFVGFFFEEFKKKQHIWQRYINVIAQLDCLMSLAVYSSTDGMVKPQFTTQQHYQVIDGKHPCLASLEFVPNDISLQQPVMLLTGPNMGGKSTILRTACLLAILAQVGSYVPAKFYKASIIDRIFTRIGASDRLQEGKSTFFIEMQETKSILNYATPKSLVIMDELGRGTSTFDGMAIAYAVLMEIVKNIRCRCLFATHYHSLIKQFRGYSEISLQMMDSLPTEDKGIIFLYKLKKGAVDQSFGINVAKLVGISNSIINSAESIAHQMEKQIQNKKKLKQLKSIMKQLTI